MIIFHHFPPFSMFPHIFPMDFHVFPIAFSQPLSGPAGWRRSRRAATAGQPLQGPKPGAEAAKSLECGGHVLGICKYNYICMNIYIYYIIIYDNISIYIYICILCI